MINSTFRFDQVMSAEDNVEYQRLLGIAALKLMFAQTNRELQEEASRDITKALRIPFKYKDAHEEVIPTLISVVSPFVNNPDVIASGGFLEANEFLAELHALQGTAN